MGTFGGHVLPGSYFLFFALQWSFYYPFRYFESKVFRNKPFAATASTGLICGPTRIRWKIHLECWIKILFIFVGVIGEIVTGINRTTGNFSSMNAQHIAMYVAFLVASIVELLMMVFDFLPKELDYILYIFAFINEGFLFAYHLHDRKSVDRFLHVAIVYAAFGCALTGIWEYNRRTNILAVYARIFFVFLQGTWFYQVGFMLYPPFKSKSWLEDDSEHSILLAACILSFHCSFIICFLLIQFIVIRFLFVRRYGHRCMDTEEVRFSLISPSDEPDKVSFNDRTC